MTPARLPHSDTPGSMLACSSPRLFAACHVLHRRPVPRHPPCALSRLTHIRPSWLPAPYGPRTNRLNHVVSPKAPTSFPSLTHVDLRLVLPTGSAFVNKNATPVTHFRLRRKLLVATLFSFLQRKNVGLRRSLSLYPCCQKARFTRPRDRGHGPSHGRSSEAFKRKPHLTWSQCVRRT